MSTTSRNNEVNPLQCHPDESASRGDQPPQVVTVSALDELQETILERNRRIEYLEKELGDTKLQLADSKTNEDRLLLELNKMALELAEATKTKKDASSELEETRRVSEDEGDRRSTPTHRRLPSALRTSRNRVVQSVPRPGSDATVGRKRTAHPVNINPRSCASGINLLAGDAQAYTGGASQLNSSSSSINRMLNAFDLTAPDSTNSLKKRRSGADAAAGHRRLHTTAGNDYQRNEGWGTSTAATLSMSFNAGASRTTNLFAQLLQDPPSPGRLSASFTGGAAGIQNEARLPFEQQASGQHPGDRTTSSEEENGQEA